MYMVGKYRIQEDSIRRVYSNVYRAMIDQNINHTILWKDGNLVAELEIIFDILHIEDSVTGIEKAYDPRTGNLYPFEDKEGFKKLISA